jgi:hypothetical protein
MTTPDAVTITITVTSSGGDAQSEGSELLEQIRCELRELKSMHNELRNNDEAFQPSGYANAITEQIASAEMQSAHKKWVSEVCGTRRVGPGEYTYNRVSQMSAHFTNNRAPAFGESSDASPNLPDDAASPFQDTPGEFSVQQLEEN